MLDLLVRGGTVVDGTGAPARTADVAVRDGAHRRRRRDRRRRDAHVHRRRRPARHARLHRHPHALRRAAPLGSRPRRRRRGTASPRCSPATAGSRSRRRSPTTSTWLLQMLCRVEGMSADALADGRRRSAAAALGDFLDGLDGRIGVNVGANVGHCAVRRYVMGDDASERTATDDEIAAMQELVRDAMRDGRDRLHVVAARPPRRARRPRRAVEPRRARGARRARAACSPSSAAARSSSSRARFLDGLRRRRPRADPRRWPSASGRPVHLNTLTTMPHAPDGWSRSLEFAETAARRRPRDPPDVRDATARARTSRSARRSCSTRCRASATRSRCRRPRARSACATPRSASRCAPSSPTRPGARSCSSGRSSASRR